MPDFRTEYQKVYDAIREAIVTGELCAGERLPLRKMTDRFNSTVTTVREAFRILENDELIVIEPNYGALVAEVTPDTIRGHYVMREALGVMASRMAAELISEEEKIELEAFAKRCDRELMGKSLTYSEKAKLHTAFHERIVAVTRCDQLIRAVARNNLYNILLAQALHTDWVHEDPERHLKLARAITSGEPAAAEETIRQHIRDGMMNELKAVGESNH